MEYYFVFFFINRINCIDNIEHCQNVNRINHVNCIDHIHILLVDGVIFVSVFSSFSLSKWQRLL